MKPILLLAAAVLAIALLPGVAKASGPIGVYALVEKVTFEPNADKPELIRIWGVFMTALETPDNANVYSTPQRGYLYFKLPSLPSGNQDLARREWADLKSVAGTHQVVGFGAAWGPKIRVRKTYEGARPPDDYPVENGVIRINSDQPRAKALLDYKDR